MAAGVSTSVPVLVLGEGKVIADSSDIVDHIAAAHPSLGLYPAEQREAIKAFEEACNTTMAVAIRRMFYAGQSVSPDKAPKEGIV